MLEPVSEPEAERMPRRPARTEKDMVRSERMSLTRRSARCQRAMNKRAHAQSAVRDMPFPRTRSDTLHALSQKPEPVMPA